MLFAMNFQLDWVGFFFANVARQNVVQQLETGHNSNFREIIPLSTVQPGSGITSLPDNLGDLPSMLPSKIH